VLTVPQPQPASHVITPPSGWWDRAAALRKREQRAREADGTERLTVTLDLNRLGEALIEAERLTEAETMDRRKVATAAAAILHEWADIWLSAARK